MRWEYSEFLLAAYGGDNIDELTRMGNDGWELVTVDNGIAYLKRIVEGD